MLEPALIFGLEEPAGEVEIAWMVTASNVDGVARGSLSAHVATQIEAAELLEE